MMLTGTLPLLKNWQITVVPAVFLHVDTQTQLMASENLSPLAYIYIYMPFDWKSTPDLNDNDCPHLYPRSSMIQTIDIFRYSLLDLDYGNMCILTP